jgi:LAO/AO transport system kinase
MEIADIVVVNKADCTGADRTAQQLQSALALRVYNRRSVPVLKTTASTGEGVAALAAAVASIAADRAGESAQARRRRRARYLIARAAAERLARQVKETSGGSLDALADAVLAGAVSAEEAAARLLKG